VRIEIEVFRTKEFDDTVVVLVVDEHGAQEGPLCVNAAWKRSF
jgi:hypothetical protein